MSEFQTSDHVVVAIQRETANGTPATDSAGSASVLPITDSPGLNLKRSAIKSAVRRRDGTEPMGRLGNRSVDGSYNGEMMVCDAVDMLLEAIMRAVWLPSTALMTADNTAAHVSMNASSTSVLTLIGTGSFLTAGVKVGDVVRLTNMTNPLNSNLNLRVTAVAANTVTFAGTPLIVDTASTTAVLTRVKKLTTPTEPVHYTHTVEEYDAIIDYSQIFVGCRVTGFSISFKPNSMATFSVTLMGLDRKALVPGTSPYFTTPTETFSISLVADDSMIRFDGADVATFTGFDLNFAITAAGQPVIGSTVSPNIFDSQMAVSGSLTGLRKDFANLTRYDNETEFELSIMLQAPSTVAPLKLLAFYLPRVKIGELSAPAGGGDGPKIETLSIMSATLDSAGAGHDATIANIYSA